MKKVIILLLLSLLLIAPASALITNNTQNGAFVDHNTDTLSSSYIHDSNYVPWYFEILFILVGLLCLEISRIIKNAEDIFSIGAVIPLGLSAWYANFMTFEQINICSLVDIPHIVYTEIITPIPALSIVMVVFFLLSIINVLWIFFLQPADEGLEGNTRSI